MVRIDDKVKEIITKIKLEEAQIAPSRSFSSYLIKSYIVGKNPLRTTGSLALY